MEPEITHKHKTEERWIIERKFAAGWKAVASRASEVTAMETLEARRSNNPNTTYRLVKRVRLITESREVQETHTPKSAPIGDLFPDPPKDWK